MRSDRWFEVDAPVDVVWAVLARPDRYEQWWPWLRRLDAEGLVAGEVWGCRVRAPLGYPVRFDVVLREVVDGRRVTAGVDGDIVGDATVTVTTASGRAGPGTTRLRFTSELAPAGRFLRVLTAVAAPVARRNHDRVVDRAIEQFVTRAFV